MAKDENLIAGPGEYFSEFPASRFLAFQDRRIENDGDETGNSFILGCLKVDFNVVERLVFASMNGFELKVLLLTLPKGFDQF